MEREGVGRGKKWKGNASYGNGGERQEGNDNGRGEDEKGREGIREEERRMREGKETGN